MASIWLGGETPRTTARNQLEVTNVGIGVTKKDRAALQSNDKKGYYKVRDAAITGLTTKFIQLQAIDEKSSIEHFEKVYSVVTKFDNLKRHMVTNDMIDVFSIPSTFTLNTSTGDYLPSTLATSVNLFSDANQVPLETIKYANCYFLKYGASYHGENVAWSGEAILNSCDSSLRDKLVELTRGWNAEHKGGLTYLKLLLNLILSTSQKSLQLLTDKLGKLRITDFPGENVTQAVSFLRGTVLILRDNKAIPSDLQSLVLCVFKVSTCDTFRLHIMSIESLTELGVKQYSLDTLLTDIDSKYIDLLGRGE